MPSPVNWTSDTNPPTLHTFEIDRGIHLPTETVTAPIHGMHIIKEAVNTSKLYHDMWQSNKLPPKWGARECVLSMHVMAEEALKYGFEQGANFAVKQMEARNRDLVELAAVAADFLQNPFPVQRNEWHLKDLTAAELKFFTVHHPDNVRKSRKRARSL